MTTSEPLLPHPGDDDERVAAADPGRGAPETAPGLGVGGEEPDAGEDAEEGAGEEAAAAGAGPDAHTPFRTPQPPER